MPESGIWIRYLWNAMRANKFDGTMKKCRHINRCHTSKKCRDVKSQHHLHQLTRCRRQINLDHHQVNLKHQICLPSWRSIETWFMCLIKCLILASIGRYKHTLTHISQLTIYYLTTQRLWISNYKRDRHLNRQIF